jgi:phosphohistidine swiveling domain-containing protein
MQLILSGIERRDNVLKRLQTHCKGTLTREWDGKSIPVIVGNLHGADNIQIACREQNIPYILIDHGYFHRSHDLEWARFCVNNYHCTDWRVSDRETPKVHEYRSGENVVVLPPAEKISYIYNASLWLDTTIEEIRKYTERKIVIKRKGEGDFKQTLEKAHVIVSFGSVADVEALIRGVPVIGSPYSPANPVSNNIKDIENLTYFDRTAWLSSLAASEWHKDEMDKCWDRLKGQLDGSNKL